MNIRLCGLRSCSLCDCLLTPKNMIPQKTGWYNRCRLCHYEQNRESYRKNQKNWRTKYRVKKNQKSKEYRLKLRKDVIEGYGGRCFCCGETTFEFLSLDHVNGGGNKHRESVGQQGVWNDARARCFPPEYRVACYNCNLSIGFLGYCPHQKKVS